MALGKNAFLVQEGRSLEKKLSPDKPVSRAEPFNEKPLAAV